MSRINGTKIPGDQLSAAMDYLKSEIVELDDVEQEAIADDVVRYLWEKIKETRQIQWDKAP